MSKFSKKRGKSNPKISTASLPDIIFMLLFFFMVVTVLRNSELKLTNNLPSASELTKIEKKSLANNIFIGKPLDKYQAQYGSSPRLQLGDKFADVNDIPIFLEQHRVKVGEKMAPYITSALKVDGEVTMGIVTDIKTTLRKAGQYRVLYSAKPKGTK